MTYTKEYISSILNHQIRNDTYYFINRMINGEAYEDIATDLEAHRKELNLLSKNGAKYPLSKQITIQNYINILLQATNSEEQPAIVSVDPEEEARKEVLREAGIYGVYKGDVLIYIGKTDVNFSTAFSHHRSAVKRILNKASDGENDTLLHKTLATFIESQGAGTIHFKPLIIYSQINLGTQDKLIHSGQGNDDARAYLGV